MPVYAQKTISVDTGTSSAATALSTPWIPFNIHETPFNVGFGVVKGGGGDIVYRVEHTFDNVFDPGVTPTAFTHEDVSAATGNEDGNYAFGVRAMRMTTVSASGSSSLTLTAIQVGV